VTQRLIDTHAHVFLKDMPHVPNPRHKITYDYTIEEYLQTLDRHGVERAVLAAASPYGDYNDYLIDSIRGQPRLRGTVIVEPSAERYTLEAMKRDHVVGVRLAFINLDPVPDISSFEYQRLLRRFRDLDWHVHLHLDGPRLPLVMPALEASGVKLVVDHYGRPDPKLGVHCAGFQMLLRALQKGNTWVKVSAGYRLGRERTAAYGLALLKEAPERLVWASDCPFVGHEGVKYQETIDDVLAWVPAGPARDQIFWKNADKLYFS
jgi:predicted TIM-barrel fold metal-dependent hydrolase